MNIRRTLWMNVLLFASSSVGNQNDRASPDLQDVPSRWLGGNQKCSRDKSTPDAVGFGQQNEDRRSTEAIKDPVTHAQILDFNLKCYSCPNCENISPDLLVPCPSSSTACVNVSGNGIIVRGCGAPSRNGIVYGCNTFLGITTCTCGYNGCNGSERMTCGSSTLFLLCCIAYILQRK